MNDASSFPSTNVNQARESIDGESKVHPTYDFVLFDWDGCLAQTLDVWISVLELTYTDFGINPGREIVAANFGDWSSATRFGLASSDSEAFYARLYERIAVALPKVELYPGVLDLLRELSACGVLLGIVTSSDPEHLQGAVMRHDIMKYFGTVVTLQDVTHHKPHPESLELALTRLGGSKERAVMIGDSTKDLYAAKNAGLKSILFFPPEHGMIYDFSTLEAAKPDYICSSFAAMRELLLNRKKGSS